jgi:ribonuclease P protein component
MNTGKETFNKSERLCSTRIIAGLAENGNVAHTALFRVLWQWSPSVLPFPARTAFSVPKKSFRLAVTRNLIKRRLREAYRKNKYILYDFLEQEGKQIVMLVIMRGSEVHNFDTLHQGMKELMVKMTAMIRKNDN